MEIYLKNMSQEVPKESYKDECFATLTLRGWSLQPEINWVGVFLSASQLPGKLCL